MNNCYHCFKCELSILNEKHDKLGGKYKLSNLLDFMGDLVDIDAGIGCLLLVITVSALKYQNLINITLFFSQSIHK